MEKLTLYVGTVCPFCKKVEAFMEDAGIDSVEIKNIDEDKDAREYLIEKGGKSKCLASSLETSLFMNHLTLLNT